MDSKTKHARHVIKNSSKEEYFKLVDKAKLPPQVEGVLYLHIIRDMSIYAIGLKLALSDVTVKRNLQRAYEGIARVIFG